MFSHFRRLPFRKFSSYTVAPLRFRNAQNLQLVKHSNFNCRFFTTTSKCFAAEFPYTTKTVKDRILLVLSLFDKIDPNKLTLESNFHTDLGLDSLDKVEVIMALEDEFQFEIPDGHADKMDTPKDVYQYICDKHDVYE